MEEDTTLLSQLSLSFFICLVNSGRKTIPVFARPHMNTGAIDTVCMHVLDGMDTPILERMAGCPLYSSSCYVWDTGLGPFLISHSVLTGIPKSRPSDSPHAVGEAKVQ
jgi:hypothetical protein